MAKKSLEYDVLIIGTGIAGLSSAISLSEQGKKVALITNQEKPEESNTYWAQGGIIYINEDDSQIGADIQLASAKTSHDDAIKFLEKHSKKILDDLLLRKAKTQFTRGEKGELKFTQEAAHSFARIIYNDDATGKAIEIALLNYLEDECDSVDLFTSMTAIDLITPSHHGKNLHQRYEQTRVVGAYVLDQKKQEVVKFLSKRTILATGGVNALYLHHTNSLATRGDGHAMARRAGAELLNMEYIQFHPTTFLGPSRHRRFLISEAVRGEGAKLVTEKGERFMGKYHSDLELAPRDVVSKAIISEMINNKWDSVFLDIRHESREHLQKRFPNIFNYLLKHKLDMSEDLIPVVPAAHYTCGGIKVNLDGETSLENLFAVGEVSCTGLHGKNRLASTSLLEGLTWGYQTGSYIADELNQNPQEKVYEKSALKEWEASDEEIDISLINQDKKIIKNTMWNYVGINKSRNRLLRAKAMFGSLYEQVHKFYRGAELNDELIGLRNSIEVALIIVNASLRSVED